MKLPLPTPIAHTTAVNRGSRIALAAACFLLVAPSLARADRVLLHPVSGRADDERLQAVEQIVSDVLREQGHTVVPPATPERPRASAQMETQAAAANASYVVLAEMEPLRGQYRFHVQVYFRPNGRLEDLVATVLVADERARISDILSSMVRREGLGEDALRLTGTEQPTDPTPTDPAEAERLRREAEEAARLEAEERARREQDAQREEEERRRREEEERARREQDAQAAWNARPLYGADGHWMIQAGAGGRYLATLGSLPRGVQGGGGLFDVSLQIGRTFDGLEGFELRGGLDFTTGAFTALGVHVGAAWLGSFFVEPVYIGVGGEVGAIFTFTGSRDVGFSARIGALFAWRPLEHVYLEASLPEIGIVTPGASAVTIGASLRAGYRFD